MPAFEILLLKMNDGRIDSSELSTMIFCTSAAFAAAVILYILYRISLSKVSKILKLSA